MSDTNAPPATEVWDRFAADYEAHAHPFTRRYAEDAWASLAAPPGSRVIDVAAGAGALTSAALADGADVTAIDFSPAMVALLRRRLAEAGHDPARVHEMDGQALAFPDESFDVACSIFGVMLFPDPAAGLAEMARVVRRGGRAAVAVWATAEGAGPLPLLYQAHRELFPDRPTPIVSQGMATLADEERLGRALTTAGFERVEVRRIAHPWTFPSADWPAANADALFGAARLWTELDAPDRDVLRAAITERLRVLPEPALRSEALVALAYKPA